MPDDVAGRADVEFFAQIGGIPFIKGVRPSIPTFAEETPKHFENRRLMEWIKAQDAVRDRLALGKCQVRRAQGLRQLLDQAVRPTCCRCPDPVVENRITIPQAGAKGYFAFGQDGVGSGEIPLGQGMADSRYICADDIVVDANRELVNEQEFDAGLAFNVFQVADRLAQRRARSLLILVAPEQSGKAAAGFSGLAVEKKISENRACLALVDTDYLAVAFYLEAAHQGNLDAPAKPRLLGLCLNRRCGHIESNYIPSINLRVANDVALSGCREMRLEKRHWDALCLQIDAAGNTSAASDASVSAHMVSELFSARLWENSLQLTQVADRRKLFGFAALWGLTLHVFQVAGAAIAACNINLPEPASFQQTTVSGKGFTIAQAVLSCLGEAVEIVSWIYQRTDVERFVDSAHFGGLAAISAERVFGFSPAQIRDRSRLNRRWTGGDSVPPGRLLQNPEFGIEVSNLAGSYIAWCPAFLAFGGFGEIHHDDKTLNADSNGCAAGASRDAANESAVLELIERDATGIWWWRGCNRARLGPEFLDEAGLNTALAEHSQEMARRVWFLDISTFENASVVAAISCDANGRNVAMGFAAAFSISEAARSAFLELIQTELAIEAHEFRVQNGVTSAAAADSKLAQWLASVDLAKLNFLLGTDNPKTNEQQARRGTLSTLTDEMASDGHHVWFASLERPEIRVPVVKAICEGLAHFKPRFGCQRVWRLPETRGWEVTFGGPTSRRPPQLLI